MDKLFSCKIWVFSQKKEHTTEAFLSSKGILHVDLIPKIWATLQCTIASEKGLFSMGLSPFFTSDIKHI